MAQNLVGIDLGTTFSALAALDERGQAETIPNIDGEMLTPSAVLIDGSTAVVGAAARDVALDRPEDVAMLIKRDMGYANYSRTVAGRHFRPETLSAIILRKLVQDAERRLGPITRAVITVPAYFDDTRRKATKDAGRIAGLEVVDILDEPTAAALAYSFQQKGDRSQGSGGRKLTASVPEQTVLVYDLGGGTFDVTLVRLSPLRFESLGIEGDVRLGGKDWDDRIVNHVAEKFIAEHGIDPRNDPQALANLSAAAERAKKTLSKISQTTISCSCQGKVVAVPMTRAQFENLTRDLLIRTQLTTQQLLAQAKHTWDQVDRVLLVGGSTHMPMTAAMMQAISGRTPDNSLAVSEVVARGAAIHAGIIASRSETAVDSRVRDMLGDVVEISVNSHSLGIEVKQGQERINDILIPKNTQLPTASSRVYRTVTENQSRVRVKVLQGDAHQADACISIGECWIEDLPPQLPKYSPIQVRCGVASNGLINVMALDMTSGKMVQANMHRSSGLTDEEIAREAEYLRSLQIQ